MNELDLLKVLWVEDENLPYIEEAEQYDLYLCQYRCWDDAKKELEEKYDQYSAIILDAKCKFHVDSADNAVRFLGEALKDIASLAVNRKRTIPWFVLTGGDAFEVSDSINVDRLRWDRDWTTSTNKVYYSKNTDRKILFSRIKAIAKKSPRLQIQEIYKNVFNAIEECGLSDDVFNEMEDLLIPIHFPFDLSDQEYNKKYVSIRIILENIFKSMGKYGIIPEWGNEVNVKWSCCLLSGMDATSKSSKIIHYECLDKTPILPKVLQSSVHEMEDAVPTTVHANTDSKINHKRIIPNYLPQVDNSSFLLKSYTFQLCDLILWYKNYLKDHKNIEENKKKWKKVQ